MKLHDQHLHSRYSMDSKADPKANCLQAIAQGLSGLTFTEHYDSHPTDRESCIWDYSAIADTVSGLREEFADQIKVGLGIEVCYQPTVMSEILEYLENHDFDFVLLSIHWCDNSPLHVRDVWTGLDYREMTRTYLETVLEALQLCLKLKQAGERPFDVLGHMDVVKRYTQRYWNTFDIREYTHIINEIWRTAIAANIPPEINTSTLRDSVGEPMPAQWTIDQYVELGGKIMSIGSDAHRSDHIGANFEEATAILKQAGIEAEAIFTNREMDLISLG